MDSRAQQNSTAAINSSLRKQKRVDQVVKNLVPVYDRKTIKQAATEVAQKIYDKHSNNPDVLLVTVLKGGEPFANDVKKALNKLGWHGFAVDHVDYSSYGDELSAGKMNIRLKLKNPKGKTVIFLEDLVETGETLKTIVADAQAQGAALVETAVLIDKVDHHDQSFVPTYTGIQLKENPWLVGHGLDQEGLARNLRFIGALQGEAKDNYLQQLKKDKEADLEEQNQTATPMNR